MLTSVDLNADVGEGISGEVELLSYLSSINLSCGAHAGSHEEIRGILGAARKTGVQVGAHPSLPDREGFGRGEMEISPQRLRISLMEQLRFLKELSLSEGVKLSHVKPHGFLYHLVSEERRWAELFLQVLEEAAPGLAVYLPTDVKTKGIFSGRRVVLEAFLDRGCTGEGRLVPRSEPGALLTAREIPKRVHDLLEGYVESVDGKKIPVEAQSFCIHSDTPEALPMLREARRLLEASGVRIAPPALS